MIRGFFWCEARIFWDYHLGYRILLTLWQQSLHYSRDLVLLDVVKLVGNLVAIKRGYPGGYPRLLALPPLIRAGAPIGGLAQYSGQFGTV